MQDDKISFDTFLKSDNCVPNGNIPKENIFKNTKEKIFDFSFVILIIIAAASIALCILYYKEAFMPIDDTYNIILGNSSSSSQAPQKVGDKVNINTADIETLCTLKSIGESRALEIVSYRIANGPFKDIADIKNVNGIGETIFNKIKDSICV